MKGRILPFRSRAEVARRGGGDIPMSAAEQERFRRLVLPHLDGAYNFARFLCRDGALAEDIVHDAFLRACRGFADFRGDNPKAWLFAIVRNGVFSAASAARTRAEVFAPGEPDDLVDAQAEDAQGPEAAIIRSSEIEIVRGAIEALPQPFRETLVLRELEELSYREVAAITGAPIGTVMSRLARARRMLATALASQEEMRA